MTNRNLIETRRPTVFLDRDGVINRDVGYVYRLEDLEILPGVPKALSRLADAGFLLVILTNQSGIARGLFTERDANQFNTALKVAVKSQGGPGFDGIYMSPYHPDGCITKYAKVHPSRKPGIGMIVEACRQFAIDLDRSYLVGDKWSDVECGVRAGVKAVQVATGADKRHQGAWRIVKDLTEGAEVILADAKIETS